jgi:hypothetical protein
MSGNSCWSVDFTSQDALDELSRSFGSSAHAKAEGWSRLLEWTVALAGPLKVQIISGENPPLHFRISYQRQFAVYRITDATRVAGALNQFDDRVKRWHKQHKHELIYWWNTRRPADCPVGPYKEGA